MRDDLRLVDNDESVTIRFHDDLLLDENGDSTDDSTTDDADSDDDDADDLEEDLDDSDFEEDDEEDEDESDSDEPDVDVKIWIKTNLNPFRK